MMNDSIGKTPDFSDGTEFLARLHGRINQRRLRQTRLAGLIGIVGAVAVFVTSFSSIARQIENDQWDSYLVEEVRNEQYLDEMEANLAWEIYLNDFDSGDDLGQLLDQILEFEGGEELLTEITLKG